MPTVISTTTKDRTNLTPAQGVQDNVLGAFHEYVEMWLAWHGHDMIHGSLPDQAANPLTKNGLVRVVSQS